MTTGYHNMLKLKGAYQAVHNDSLGNFHPLPFFSAEKEVLAVNPKKSD